MNGIIKNTLRPSIIKNLFSTTSSTGITCNQLRTLWNVSRQTQITSIVPIKLFKHENVFCNYNCCRNSHSKGIFNISFNLFYHLIINRIFITIFKYIFRKDLQVVNYFCKEILSLRIIYNHV